LQAELPEQVGFGWPQRKGLAIFICPGERFRIVAECSEAADKSLVRRTSFVSFLSSRGRQEWVLMRRNVPTFAPSEMLIWAIDIGKASASN
jgi:hypothetical protein